MTLAGVGRIGDDAGLDLHALCRGVGDTGAHQYVPALLRIGGKLASHRVRYQPLGQVAGRRVAGTNDAARAELRQCTSGEREQFGVRERFPVHADVSAGAAQGSSGAIPPDAAVRA